MEDKGKKSEQHKALGTYFTLYFNKQQLGNRWSKESNINVATQRELASDLWKLERT